MHFTPVPKHSENEGDLINFVQISSMKKEGENKKGNHPVDGIRLNKFIANSGVCSRREADELIARGEIEVNGKEVRELGIKVNPGDQVKYRGKVLKPEKYTYVLLNKPKDFITTVKDTHGRKTVMDLIKNACDQRVYPVGRLDKDTTGLLLFTNDGDLAKTLTHPRYEVRKLYRVTLNKRIDQKTLNRVLEGIELEDGFVKADDVSFVEGVAGNREVGIELHSGKNRIVRRIFRHLGFEVVKLDRVVFADLTKKDLPRGKWRLLNTNEVGLLKRKYSKGAKNAKKG